MRAVSVAFSPGRPSRLKNEPGILPAAYMRSSTSTVSGRKSTSRRLPATAVQRTIVSPWRTTTAPEACLAILPVSKEISLPAICTETRVTASLLIGSLPFLFRPFARRHVFFSLIERNELSGPRRAGARLHSPRLGPARRERGDALAHQLRRRQLAGRGRLKAPAHYPVGIDHHQCALGEAARVQHAEGGADGALGLEVRELLAADAELLPERPLRPRGVA